MRLVAHSRATALGMISPNTSMTGVITPVATSHAQPPYTGIKTTVAMDEATMCEIVTPTIAVDRIRSGRLHVASDGGRGGDAQRRAGGDGVDEDSRPGAEGGLGREESRGRGVGGGGWVRDHRGGLLNLATIPANDPHSELSGAPRPRRAAVLV